MTFRVGMKVVCIDDSRDNAGRELRVQQGGVYTIAKLGLCDPASGCCGMTFTELGGGLYDGKWLWCHTRFRPAVERKTSIEIFTAMLKPSKVEA